MTIDIDELERKAIAAKAEGSLVYKVPSNTPIAWHNYLDAVDTETILALIRRVREAEELKRSIKEELTALKIVFATRGQVTHEFAEEQMFDTLKQIEEQTK